MLHYLFGFGGRINRAKMWLFLAVTIVWEIVAVLVAAFGLHWSHYMQAVEAFARKAQPFAPAPMPFPDPISGNGWIAVGVLALLLVLYLVAYAAVIVKRLHDREKGAIWLLPFIVLPWLLDAFVWWSGPMAHGWPQDLFIGPVGMARGAAYVLALALCLWMLADLYFLRGTAGNNRFGRDPLVK